MKIKRLDLEATLPKYKTEGAAGMDIYALRDIEVRPGTTIAVPTGFAVELPKNTVMDIRGRSGLTLNTKLRVNLGTIDSDYRGEVLVLAENTTRGTDSIMIKKGERIAQAVVYELASKNLIVVEDLEETERGDGGFGSTGTNDKEETNSQE